MFQTTLCADRLVRIMVPSRTTNGERWHNAGEFEVSGVGDGILMGLKFTSCKLTFQLIQFGDVLLLVPEVLRAWHAGTAEWAGQGDINSRSIGIELDNRGTHPFPEPQMTALEGVLRGIMARWNIPPHGVIGHSDIAPDRKVDPGPHFDWVRLARQGLSQATPFCAQGPATQARFRAAAQAAGYTADVPLETLLGATRLRHAPWRKGPLCTADLALPVL